MALSETPQIHTPIVLSGYTGSGKDTIAHRIVDSSPALGGKFFRSASRFTDRDPRPGEIPGVDAHFVSPQSFQDHKAHGDFFYDYGKYGQNFAFSWPLLQQELQQGHSFIIGGEIDTASRLFYALQERMKRENRGVEPLMVFVNRALNDILQGIDRRPGAQPEKEKRIAHVQGSWEPVPALLARMQEELGPDRVKYIWNQDVAESALETRQFISRALATTAQQQTQPQGSLGRLLSEGLPLELLQTIR